MLTEKLTNISNVLNANNISTKQQCIIRECNEELDITISIDNVFADITKEDLYITFFICRIVEGTIKLKEHQDSRWVTKEELSDYTFCPADTKVIEMLQKNCNR